MRAEVLFEKLIATIEATSVATGVEPDTIKVTRKSYESMYRWFENRLNSEYGIKIVVVEDDERGAGKNP